MTKDEFIEKWLKIIPTRMEVQFRHDVGVIEATKIITKTVEDDSRYRNRHHDMGQ